MWKDNLELTDGFNSEGDLNSEEVSGEIPLYIGDLSSFWSKHHDISWNVDVHTGDELLTAVKEIQSELTDLGCTVYVQGHHGNLPALPVGMLSFDEQFDNADDSPIPKSVRNGIRPEDALCYIYTSGTTGMSIDQMMFW